SPDGHRLAWVTWDLPAMPWNSSDLWVAELDADGRPGAAAHVAGGARESIYQPTWSPDGTLYFASDRSGYWNLHRLRDGEVEPVWPIDAEIVAGDVDIPMFAFASKT